jgi:hypothetical protein
MSSFEEKPSTKHIDELFPNYSSFERAVSYPYPAPDFSFSFYKGEFVKGIRHDLESRIPILSVGSNRSPYQLKRKFTLDEDICVTPAILFDSDIVYAASISAYGSVPATQWPSKGASVALNVLWLKEDQLNKMHLTEGLGIAYHFVKLTTGTVKIEDFDYTKDIYGYISVPGVFPFQGNLPRRLSSIGGDNIKLNEFSETNAVLYLKETMGDKKLSLDQWLKKIINDEEYRFSKLKLLRAKAIKPKNPNWEIVNVTTKGKLIV